MNQTRVQPSALGTADLISFEIRFVVHFIFFIVLCGFVCVLGMVTNLFTIIVFVKQGFKDSTNISLLGLAVADFMCLLTMFWISLSASQALTSLQADFNQSDVTYFTGAWPRIYFIRINSFIMAFISFERCLCVAQPLKVKKIITPRKTKLIIVFIYIVMFIFFIPFYSVNHLQWRHNTLKNRTLLTLVYTNEKVIVETATFPVYGVAMPIVTLLCVLVCTVILVVQLNRKSQWRQQSTAKNKPETGTTPIKEKKVVKMVVLISSIFIICYFPPSILFVLMTLEPEFSFTGRYENLYYLLWSVAMFFETLNSSVNFAVYYNMSSKFKFAFQQCLCGCRDSGRAR